MILGIDFGLRNIGLAISEGNLAQPLQTVTALTEKDLLKVISSVVTKYGIDKAVVGVSEGRSRALSHSFGKKVQTMLRLKVEYVDETLSSHEAEQISRSLDKRKQHAIAAAIILQRYLDDCRREKID